MAAVCALYKHLAGGLEGSACLIRTLHNVMKGVDVCLLHCSFSFALTCSSVFERLIFPMKTADNS